MFCDLVNSTTLFAQFDPEEVSELLRLYSRCCAATIENAGGFVAQFQGDGVLGYFGYTHASESDAERAVRASLELVERLPNLRAAVPARLQIRIGISTGLTVVGDPSGEGTRLEQGAVGETLHIAARLQTLASPNWIVIAESTRRLIGRLFVCRDMGKLAIKGIEEPVQTWRVLKPRPLTSHSKLRRDPLLTQIVGRDAEIDTLLETWQPVVAGECHCVSIVGEAGIGKSRLITEFRHRMVREGHIWLEGGGAQFFGNTPFYVVTQMVKRALDPAGRASPVEFQSKLKRALEEAGLAASETLPLLVEMLGLPTPDPLIPLSVAPSERRNRLFSIILDWIHGSAPGRPLILVLEDLHWIDPSSLELVGYVLERIKTLPVLVLLSMRPGFCPPWHIPIQLYLDRLPDDALRQIIIKIGSATDPLTNEDVTRVVQRAEGVPLYGIELARLVGKQPKLGRYRNIPDSLSDLLTARLDQLGSAKGVAQAAAVIGGEVPLQVLGEVAQLSISQIRPRLATLKNHGVLYEEGTFPKLAYGFTHSLLRDAAYDALLRDRRRQLHRRAAIALSGYSAAITGWRAERLAYHWTNAGEIELAISAWQQAGDSAGASKAFMEAEQAYRNAISALIRLPPSQTRDATELVLQSSLADALRMTRGYSARETIDTTARARELADRSGDRAQQFLQMWGEWTAASSGGDHATAIGLADRFYRLALADGSFDSLAHAHMIQMTSRYRIGDLLGAEDHFTTGERFFALADFRRRPSVIAQTYGNAARISWILGKGSTAQRRIDHALIVARENDSPYDLAYAQYMAAIHAVLIGSFDLAADLAKSSIRLSDQYKFPQFAAISRIALGRAQAGLGFAGEGVTLIREGLAGMAGTSARVAMTLYKTWLAEAYVCDGSFDEALAAAEDALETNSQELFFRPETMRLRGQIYLYRGMLAKAERDFLESLALSGRMAAKRFRDRTTKNLQQLSSLARNSVHATPEEIRGSEPSASGRPGAELCLPSSSERR